MSPWPEPFDYFSFESPLPLDGPVTATVTAESDKRAAAEVIALSQRDLNERIVDAIVEQSARDAESGTFTGSPLPALKPKSRWRRFLSALQLWGNG